jgi:hypothetical protein
VKKRIPKNNSEWNILKKNGIFRKKMEYSEKKWNIPKMECSKKK